MKSYERKQLHMRLFHQNENNWLLRNTPIFSDYPKRNFIFTLTPMKSNVNRISVMEG